MPTRAPRICGCGKTVPSGQTCACVVKRNRDRMRAFGDKHEARRPSSSKRGYDAAWKRTRRLFLAEHPTCCAPGCGKPSTDADHIQSVADRPDLRLSWSNLRPFCHAHHSERTAKDQGFGRGGRGVGQNLVGEAGPYRGSSPRESAEFSFSTGDGK